MTLKPDDAKAAMSYEPQTEDEIRLLRAELLELRRKLAATQFALDAAELAKRDLKQLLRVMRSSISWRVTAPLRIGKRLARRRS